MENASRALIIIGGVLIAILIASLGVYFSRTIAEFTSNTYKKLEEANRTEFNEKFMKFNEHKVKDEHGTMVDSRINIQDVLTIINLARDSNEKNGLVDYTNPLNPVYNNPADPLNNYSLYVTVRYTGIDNSSGKGIERLSNTFQNNLEKLNRDNVNQVIREEMEKDPLAEFKCTVQINDNTGYVSYIEIQ